MIINELSRTKKHFMKNPDKKLSVQGMMPPGKFHQLYFLSGGEYYRAQNEFKERWHKVGANTELLPGLEIWDLFKDPHSITIPRESLHLQYHAAISMLRTTEKEFTEFIRPLLKSKKQWYRSVKKFGRWVKEESMPFMEEHYEQYVKDVRKVLNIGLSAWADEYQKLTVSKDSKPSMIQGIDQETYQMARRELFRFTQSSENGIGSAFWPVLQRLYVKPNLLPAKVFRGMNIHGADENYEKRKRIQWETDPPELTRITSWSSNPDIAYRFMSIPTDTDYMYGFGVLLEAVPDPDMVIADLRLVDEAAHSYWTEQEIIMKPGVKYTVKNIVTKPSEGAELKSKDYDFWLHTLVGSRSELAVNSFFGLFSKRQIPDDYKFQLKRLVNMNVGEAVKELNTTLRYLTGPLGPMPAEQVEVLDTIMFPLMIFYRMTFQELSTANPVVSPTHIVGRQLNLGMDPVEVELLNNKPNNFVFVVSNIPESGRGARRRESIESQFKDLKNVRILWR